MNIFQTIIKKRWHYHFAVSLGLIILFLSFITHKWDTDLGYWGKLAVSIIPAFVYCALWEKFWEYKNNAPWSWSDVIVGMAAIPFGVAIQMYLIPGFNIGNTFVWVAFSACIAYALWIAYRAIFRGEKNFEKDIKKRVLILFGMSIGTAFLGFIHGI